MKKRFLSLLAAIFAILSAVINAYLLFFKGETKSENSVQIQDGKMLETTSRVVTTQSVVSSSQLGEIYTDGTYTGKVISTNRGDYQVQLTVSDGKLSNITMLEWPQDNAQSKRISGNALPVYTAEALEKQSADVSLISGASEAYKGFTGSLQDALSQAKQ